MIRPLVLTLAAVVVVAGAALMTPQVRALLPRAHAPAAAPRAPAPPAAAADMGLRLTVSEARADSLDRILLTHATERDSALASAAELGKTLVRMDDPALSAVARRLDGRSFAQLYVAASPRNQTRLLAALAPDQAAAFVRFQLPGGPFRAPADSARSTSDSLRARS